MRVTREFHDIGGRKYIELDNVRVKIPWRYNRVMCRVEGLLSIQELKAGQEVKAEIEIRRWDQENFRVLKSLSTE
jgi:hypothetical protein